MRPAEASPAVAPEAVPEPAAVVQVLAESGEVS